MSSKINRTSVPKITEREKKDGEEQGKQRQGTTLRVPLELAHPIPALNQEKKGIFHKHERTVPACGGSKRKSIHGDHVRECKSERRRTNRSRRTLKFDQATHHGYHHRRRLCARHKILCTRAVCSYFLQLIGPSRFTSMCFFRSPRK